jgi:hypothetical protein
MDLKRATKLSREAITALLSENCRVRRSVASGEENRAQIEIANIHAGAGTDLIIIPECGDRKSGL